jgi:Flp pilus assembly protein TadG
MATLTSHPATDPGTGTDHRRTSLREDCSSKAEDPNLLDHGERRARHAVPLRSRHHVFTQTRTRQASTRQASTRQGNTRRGNAIVEFALVFVVFMAIIFAAFDFSYAIFVKATLHHAVREGVRYAISGRTLPGLGHDASIKQVVKDNALALLNGPEGDELIKVNYYLADGFGATPNNAAGNIVVVSVEDYQVAPVGPLLRAANPITLTVSALDKMEPFPGAAPPRI